MEAGDWATWAGAAAAGIAAAASVALWWRGRHHVTWQMQRANEGRSSILNSGSGTARRVQVRAGSLASINTSEIQVHAASVQPGEVVLVSAQPTFGDGEDYAVVVTWRSVLGRRRTWSYRLA